MSLDRKQHYSYTKVCPMCGREFKTYRYHTKTCGAKCRKRLQRTDPTYIEPRDRNRVTLSAGQAENKGEIA